MIFGLILLHLCLIYSTLHVGNVISIAAILLARAGLSALLLRLISSSWFFYFLVLVFLGGVMIIVLFIRSVCINNKIIINFGFPKGLLVGFILINCVFVNSFTKLRNFNSFSISRIVYQNEATPLLILLLVFLLLAIICVIYLSKLDQGPLLKTYYFNSLN